jgi:hypothetical protein
MVEANINVQLCTPTLSLLFATAGVAPNVVIGMLWKTDFLSSDSSTKFLHVKITSER